MDWNLKKMLPAAAASLVAVTSVLSADDAQMRNLENRVTALEQRKGANGMINPPARPEVQDGINLFVTADLLYWQAHEDSLDYAVDNHNGVAYINDGTTKEVGGGWDWGWRLGLGYNLPHDGWDLYLNWTHLNHDSSAHKEFETDGTLFTVWAGRDNNGTNAENIRAHEAKADWELRLNLLDLELGREFFVSKYMTLRPHMGFRAGWIRQEFDVSYEAINGANTLKVDTDMTNDFFGFGLRGGLNTQWGMGSGFSIFGDAAVALLYGNFHLDQDSKFAATEALLDPNVDHTFRTVRAIFDFALGLRWDHMFDGDRFHLGLQLGYEYHLMPDQLMLSQYDSGPVASTRFGRHNALNGDLSTNGWTFAARFDF